MRVVHLLRKYNPAEWGGTETAIYRLFDGLRRQDVSSVIYAPKIVQDFRVADPLREAGCEVKRFNAFVPVLGMPEHEKRQLISVGGNLMTFDLLASLWRDKEISLVHTHTLGRIGAIGRTIAKRCKIPFIITIHGGLLDLPETIRSSMQQPRRVGWDWGKLFGLLLRSRALLDHADAIVTCNPTEAALLRQKFPHKTIHVQPHGVILANYQADQRTTALKAFPQLQGRQVLLSVGRIDPVKNQGWLVSQLPAILKQHPAAILVLAGACTDEKYGKFVEKSIAGLGLGNDVLLTGGLPPGDPRLIGLLQLATAVILPSLSETFGLVLLEAWASRTAVISSRTSGATALINHDENGWLFDLENPQTFHPAVHQALSNPEQTKQLASRGHELVAEQYDTVALASRMKSLYEHLIEEKNALRRSTR